MSVNNGTALAGSTFEADELDGVYALLAEALYDITAGAPCTAADCIERAMVALGVA